MNNADESQPSEPAHDLLPPNATPIERGLSISTERITRIPVEIRDILHPEHCPQEFLPWLAWAASLDMWHERWEEGVRRIAVKQSIATQKRSGSRWAIENAVRWILALTIDPERESLDGIEELDGTFAIREWWEQEEGPPGRMPFSFEVRLLLYALLSTTEVLEGTLYRNIRRAIDAVKPVTSRYTLTVGGLDLETKKGTGTMARAVQMARFTVSPIIPSASPREG